MLRMLALAALLQAGQTPPTESKGYPADALLVLRAKSIAELVALVQPIREGAKGAPVGSEDALADFLGPGPEVWKSARMDAPLELLARSVSGTDQPAWSVRFSLQPTVKLRQLASPGWRFSEEGGQILAESGPKPGTPRGRSVMGSQLDAGSVVVEAELAQLRVCCPKLIEDWIARGKHAVEHRLHPEGFAIEGLWDNLAGMLHTGERLVLGIVLRERTANVSIAIRAEPPKWLSAVRSTPAQRDALLRYVMPRADAWMAMCVPDAARKEAAPRAPWGKGQSLEGVTGCALSISGAVSRCLLEGPGGPAAVLTALEAYQLEWPAYRVGEPSTELVGSTSLTRWPVSIDFERLAESAPVALRKNLESVRFRKMMTEELRRACGPKGTVYSRCSEGTRTLLTAALSAKAHDGAVEFLQKGGPEIAPFGVRSAERCSCWLLGHVDFGALEARSALLAGLDWNEEPSALSHLPLDYFQGWDDHDWRMNLLGDLGWLVAHSNPPPPPPPAWRNQVDTDLEQAAYAVWNYHDNNGAWPTDLGVLARPDAKGVTYFLEPKVPKDPWGREYGFLAPEPAKKLPARVFTLGADGNPGGEGDDEDLFHDVRGS